MVERDPPNEASAIYLLQMSKKKKEPGRCIFCSGGNLTKEHIWPDWLTAILPRVNTYSQQSSAVNAERQGGKVNVIISPDPMRRGQGSLIQRKVRKVCATCNSGWMSGIVSRTRNYVEELVRGRTCSLDRSNQTDLAAWAATSTIMAEFTDEKTAAIAPADRQVLMSTKAPPAEWSIFLGRYNGVQPFQYSHRNVNTGKSTYWLSMKDIPPTGKIQFTTYTLGALLVHTFSSTDVDVALKLREQFSPVSLNRIWPIKTDPMPWPSSPELEDDLVNRIADRAFAKLTVDGRFYY